MPMYEYACHQCDTTFETLVQKADEPVECPECHGTALEKLLSVPGAPKVRDGAGLPMSSACRTDLPPCGPGCCRM
jgi:putative FmdB family regulatory protein